MQLPLERLINFVKVLSLDSYSASNHFPCCLCKGRLKHAFLDSYLTILFGAGISGNTSAMRVICCWQMFKI